MKKKRPRALKKTEVGVDVVSIDKFIKHKRPDLSRKPKYFVVYCDDPDFPDVLIPTEHPDHTHIKVIVLKKGHSVDEFEEVDWS